ncbi:hypothetical protein D4R75_11400 [bacterium]|nr:MAG: hypothetical protein D4R75_11400 [bacterium]
MTNLSSKNRTSILILSVFALTTFPTRIAWSQQAPQSDLEHNVRTEQEFIAFDPDYKESKAKRVAEILALLSKVKGRETAGQNTSCSHQILWELKVLITQTADFKHIDQRIEDLKASLEHPEREIAAQLQDSIDGSWGQCFDAWYCRLNALCDAIENRENQSIALKTYPHFLDRVNSPDNLTAYLNSISLSDIPRTGVDRLVEFNLSLSNLMRLILRNQPAGYQWDPRTKATIKDLVLNRLRNPETGWWGERYIRDGRVQFVDDLSTTFHIVTYLHGEVSDLPRVITTALAVRNLNYPVGWLWKGQYWNHNNMDVGALFKAGWSQASPEQRKAMATELEKMLQWCLNESLQPDGSFKSHVADGSLEEGIYYGASFLSRIGFFDKAQRFWTDQHFASAEAVRQKIIDYILKHRNTGGSGGSYFESALIDFLGYKPSQGDRTK